MFDSKAAGFVLAISLGLAGPAAADEKVLVLRIKPGELTRETAQFIGENGKLTTVNSDRPRTIQNIVQSICATAPPAFIVAVQAANKNSAFDYATQIAAGQNILMPPCPPKQTTSLLARNVQPGDTVWGYYKTGTIGADFAPKYALNVPPDNYAPPLNDAQVVAMWDRDISDVTSDSISTKQVVGAFPLGPNNHLVRRNILDTLGVGAKFDSSGKLFAETGLAISADPDTSFVDMFQRANPRIGSADQLKPGEIVLVPDQTPQEYVLPLRDPAESTKLASLSPEAFTRKLGTPVTDVMETTDFRFFKRLADKCVPEDAARMSTVLAGARQLLEENWKQADQQSATVAPEMVFVDSGIFKPTELPAHPALLKSVDQSSPASLASSPSEAELEPPKLLPDAMHGTNVAALALGTSDFAKLARSIGYRMKVRAFRAFTESTTLALRPDGSITIVDGKADVVVHTVDRDRIFDAIKYSADSIVTLSFGREKPIDELRAKLDPLSQTLFIVAAGNDHKSLDTIPLFPGRHGGGEAFNIMTVASIDGDRKLSGFSNWSSDFVDIAAPGCGVATLSYDKDQSAFFGETVNGTSFSAPQVSYTAALIKAVRPSYTGAQIKARLLAGSDIEPALTGSVLEGRVLNMVKALALQHDVVDVRKANGERELRFGQLKPELKPDQFCKAAPDIGNLRILKVIPAFDERDAKPETTTINFADPGGLVKSATCASKDFQVTLHEISGATVQFSMGEINDITPAWR